MFLYPIMQNTLQINVMNNNSITYKSKPVPVQEVVMDKK